MRFSVTRFAVSASSQGISISHASFRNLQQILYAGILTRTRMEVLTSKAFDSTSESMSHPLNHGLQFSMKQINTVVSQEIRVCKCIPVVMLACFLQDSSANCTAHFVTHTWCLCRFAVRAVATLGQSLSDLQYCSSLLLNGKVLPAQEYYLPSCPIDAFARAGNYDYIVTVYFQLDGSVRCQVCAPWV